MRRTFSLATAALAASIAFAAPALAQGRAEAIIRFCPDMTLNQIGTGLVQLVEQYEFSADQDEAAQQAASLLCGYGDTAEVEEDAKATPAYSVVPPPHFNGPKPHFNGPKPRFAPPRHKMRPHAHRLPPPYYRPMPPPRGYGYRPAPRPPQVAFRGYGGGGYHGYQEERQPMTHQRVRSAGYCLAERSAEAFELKYPRPRASCEIGPVPGQPCPGWVCKGP